MKSKDRAALLALTAAALYALSIPLAKRLLPHASPAMMAGFLYLGAGAGLFFYGKLRTRKDEKKLTKKELPAALAMIVLDILAPIFLMLGIQRTTSAGASLLSNFEIVATALVARAFFREVISRRLWSAIALVTAASILLSVDLQGELGFQTGSLFVLLAGLCWGVENNCTRLLSSKDAAQIVTLKGLFSGLGSLATAFLLGERLPALPWIAAILVLGFFSYGLSILLYIRAQKDLGAAKTSAYYSAAPFIGAGMSLLLLREMPDGKFYAALLILIAAAVLMSRDTVTLQHTHPHTHTHAHALAPGSAQAAEHGHTHEHLHSHAGDEADHAHEHPDFFGPVHARDAH